MRSGRASGRNAATSPCSSAGQRYAPALENPPLLIVCDTDLIRIHTNFTYTVEQVHRVALGDLQIPEKLALLKLAFSEPERLKPDVTREAVTAKAAGEFAALAQRLRARGHNAGRVARFINRLLFCLFAEDIGLLHDYPFARGMTLEARPTYTPSTTFETFPFPNGMTPNIPYVNDPRAVAIAEAARRLNELRETWLSPPDLVRRVPEVMPGYPDRLLPVNEQAVAILKQRTLTKLYNDCPAWLVNAHRDLDVAVAAAYSWPADLSDDEVLRRLFELNQERAAAQAAPAEAAA